MSALNDSCSPVDVVIRGSLVVSVGDQISYDCTDHVGLKRLTVRREARVVELWHEQHTTIQGGLHYAELDDGRRAWFHRDHVGIPGHLGAPLEGALF